MGRAPRWVVAGALLCAAQLPFVVTAPPGGASAAAATTPVLPSNCTRTAVTVTCTFAYNGTNGSDGAAQPFVVPARVTSIRVEAWGGSGGDLPPIPPQFQVIGDPHGGPGGHAAATFAVSPGAQLSVRVGGHPQAGAGGFDGGGSGQVGGGGASDVRIGGDALTNRVLVAAGGGGTGLGLASGTAPVIVWSGGTGGGPTGAAGTCGASAASSSPECGGGATSAGGGTGGQSFACARGFSTAGLAGASGLGGTGGESRCIVGSNVLVGTQGAGGGGGFFGGGGGGAFAAGGNPVFASGAGGGGSGFVRAGASGVVDELGTRVGNGLVTITYVVARTPPNVFACLHGGWRTFVDGRGRRFPDVLRCVIWALLHHRH